MTQQDPIKLVALVHADVKDYSHLMDADESATIGAITTFKKRMNDLAEAPQGKVISSAGGGFLLKFGSAQQAVEFASTVDRTL
jgi:class 3 adenylate cyclase